MSDPLHLAREYADFFIALAAAFQRAQIYPGGHPTLDRAVGQLGRRLDPLLRERITVSFAVGPAQLYVAGATTDPGHGLHRELASRLFRRNVGAVRIDKGVTRHELLQLLEAYCHEPSERTPLLTTHIAVEPLSFEALALDSSGEPPPPSSAEERAQSLWSGLAERMLGSVSDLAHGVFDGTGADRLAQAFEALPVDRERDEAVIGYLRELAAQCGDRDAADSVILRRQITRLLRGLRRETIDRLLALAGSVALQHDLLLDLVNLSSAAVALELLRATLRVDRRTLSPALLQLLAKLASHADRGKDAARRLAEEGFHEALRSLIQAWDEPEPAEDSELQYEETLDHLPAPLVADLDPVLAYRSDPLRLLTISLDMGEVGDLARRAVRTLVARGRIRPLVKLLDELSDTEPLGQEYRPLVVTPDALAALLSVRPVDLESVERLAPEIGPLALPVLLDALAAAEERGLRRRLLELAARFGNAAAPYAITRYRGAPWYVQRNLLRLLQMLPDPPAETVLSDFAEHPDPRVRVEGLRLLLRHPAGRPRGVVQALTDEDPVCLSVGVMAAAEECPPAAAPPLIRRLTEGPLDQDLRPAAIRALAPLDQPGVLELLLRLAARRVFLLGLRVAPKSKESLAALTGLARHWQWHPRVMRLLVRAGRHRDPAVRHAVELPSVLQQLGYEPAPPPA